MQTYIEENMQITGSKMSIKLKTKLNILQFGPIDGSFGPTNSLLEKSLHLKLRYK
jgi:hypothetical protein